MKKIGFLLFLLQVVLAHASDTLHVVTHRRETIVTDPAKGFRLYKRWGIFPSSNAPVRKIVLHVRFGCPDSLRCADWDYKDQITLRRKGGVNGASQDVEIARMLTPYGGAFPKDWNFNWEVDVTDFSLLLRDSVEIEYNHNGYEPANDRGWAVTLDFEVIKGTPAWEPVSIQKIYDNSYRYGDSSRNIESVLQPVSFTASQNADFARLRVVQTGHGMDNPDGCGEFCNKWRQIFFDGKLVHSRNIWKTCGDNPLYPQAGTWLFDRAAWCPGNLVQPDVLNLQVTPGKVHTLDINMQPYVSSNPSADEVLSAYVIQYKKAKAATDVQLLDVINPSAKDAFRRYNPSAMPPVILVQNMGADPVKRFTVRYGTRGFAQKTFQWKGLLLPFAIDTITLPGVVEGKANRNEFSVAVLNPNGKMDGFPADNQLAVSFQAVPKYDSVVILYLLTNNEPSQTAYTLVNSEGKVMRQRVLGSLQAATLYRDTLQLPRGVYQLTLLDSAGNGLEFWANSRGGRGKARLLNGKGDILKDFESDFGASVQYGFAVTEQPDPITAQTSFGLYPTRTNDKTNFDFAANQPEDLVVQLVTDPGGQVVEEHRYFGLKEGMFTYDLSRFPKGRFYLKVLIRGQEAFKKRIRLKE